MNRCCAIILMGVVGWCLPWPAAAATPSTDWITAGVGTGHRSDNNEDLIFQHPSFLLAVSVQRGWNVGSVRYARVGMSQGAGDLAVLFERARPWKRAQVTGGVGVGLPFRNESIRYSTCDGFCGDTEYRLERDGFGRCGLAWSVEIVSRQDPAASIGLTAFGNLAGERSFWGIAAVFEFGEFE